MSQNYQRHHNRDKFTSICFIFVVMLGGMSNLPASAKTSDSNSLPPVFSGEVLVNIRENYGSTGFIEYTLSLPDGVLKETNRGKKGFIIKHPVYLPTLSSESFGRTYEEKRLYWRSMEDDLTANFSPGNLEYYDRLLNALIRKQGDFHRTVHPSTITEDKIRRTRSPLKYLRPNRQFTKIIFFQEESAEPHGLLIDVSRKKVSFPFEYDLIYDFAWDNSGQRIAYSSARDWAGPSSVLVVKDVSRNVTLFRLDLDKKSINDIAWDSSGKYIAVLSAIFSRSYSPLGLLANISGHPMGDRTYYLDVFDIDGNYIYQSKEKDLGTFPAGRGSGRGVIVWVEKEATLSEPVARPMTPPEERTP